MERYGRDFDRDRWGAEDRGFGWGGGASQGRPRGRSGGGYDRQGGYGGYGAGMGGGRAGQQRGGGQFRGGYGGGYGGYDTGGYGGSQGDRASRVRAAEIMTEDPETVTPDTPLADAARKMRDLNVGIIPVVESADSRRLRGVVTDRDIAVRAVAEGRDPGKTKVADVMTTELETCNKNDSVREIMNVMEREQVRRVPITDREGRLVGIVAQADVAVDFLGEQPRARPEVAGTLRRVSEPAEPESGAGSSGGRGRGGAGRASRQRGDE